MQSLQQLRGSAQRGAPRATTMRPSRALSVALRCSVSPPTTAVDKAAQFKVLEEACTSHKKASSVEKLGASTVVLNAFTSLKENGSLAKWGSSASEALRRRNVFMGELRQVGIKNPDKIAVPSVRNDAAFLATVTVSTSVLAVAAGQLPGDWGFFSAYLIGGITIAVLAVGSTAPGLLQFAIDKFSQVFPDYRERVIKHEAAHFLLGYLLGVPVMGYSLIIGNEHTEFAEAKIQKRIFERQLEDAEIDTLAVVAVAGVAAEGRDYEEVMGQTADLFDLQRILLRSKTKLSDSQQQNITRWAVWQAGSLLRAHQKEHQALIAAMAQGASVSECIQAIESA